MNDSIPDGFEPLSTNSPFYKHVGPLYCRKSENAVIMGLRIEEQHCNSSGRLHGSMVCAISDVALGHNIGLALAESGAYENVKQTEVRGAPIHTVSMSTDFVGAAKLGEWVEVHVDVQRAGRSLAFASAYMFLNAERIARTSAVFKVKGTP